MENKNITYTNFSELLSLFQDEPERALQNLIQIGDLGKQHCMVVVNDVEIRYNPFEPKPFEDLIEEYRCAMNTVPNFDLMIGRKELQSENFRNVLENMYKINFQDLPSIIRWIYKFSETIFDGAEYDKEVITNYFNENMDLRNCFADYNIPFEFTVEEYQDIIREAGIKEPENFRDNFASGICASFVNDGLSVNEGIKFKAREWLRRYNS
jgi:hypothetical protein